MCHPCFAHISKLAFMSAEPDDLDLVERTAAAVRGMIIDGRLLPGEQLPETSLAAELSVSRNTLRESFRILMHENLVSRQPNRGVFVHRPTLAQVLDVYRVRRIIEEQAVRQAVPKHPAIAAARAAVDDAVRHREAGEWRMVCSMNMAFHAALVALADSDHLDDLFRRLQAELRLAFSTLDDPEYLHSPFVEENLAITELLEAGRMDDAADRLDAYFARSERTVVATFGRR